MHCNRCLCRQLELKSLHLYRVCFASFVQVEIGDDVGWSPILFMDFTKNNRISSAVFLTPLLSVYTMDIRDLFQKVCYISLRDIKTSLLYEEEIANLISKRVSIVSNIFGR